MGEFFGGKGAELQRAETALPELENATAEIKNLVREKPFIRESLTDLWQEDRRITFKHSVETAKLAAYVCDELGIAPEERKLLIGSALVHDVGKIFIDKEILDKASELTPAETQKIRDHVRKGFNYLKGKGVKEEADIMVGHHQHKNYPRNAENDKRQASNIIGLDGRRGGERRQSHENLEKLTRILSILDIFESMSDTQRPYNRNREIFPKRKQELEKFNAPLEKQVIEILEKREAGSAPDKEKIIPFQRRES